MPESDILKNVSDFYLKSGDFNGLPMTKEGLSTAERERVSDLLASGFLQVVSDSDYPNIHIRPWASKRSIQEQISDFAVLEDGRAFCLYPTARAMAGREELDQFKAEPYRQRIAAGGGRLELAYFTIDVIEQYRNDPRYRYLPGDFEVEFGVRDDVYLDPGEADRDKIPSLRVGFAYDSTTLSSSTVKRYACAFLCDLANLTPDHQQRWATYEVGLGENIGPHPAWWAMQMGHWSNGLGPFERVIHEMKAINELFLTAYGVELFRSTARPREWGWVLRPTTSEWDQFIHLSDKLLSENLRKQALDTVNARTVGDNGSSIGTINRLRYFISDSTPTPPDIADQIVGAFRTVRKERQRPAHAITLHETDGAITARQRDMLSDVGHALSLFRMVLQQHPSARDWLVPEYLDKGGYRL